MGARQAGSTATPLKNWRMTRVNATGNDVVVLAGQAVFSASSLVGTVTGTGGITVVSGPAAGGATGMYRVYVPACLAIYPMVEYGSTATTGNEARISAISAGSGYFDVAIASAAGASIPTSGDFMTFQVFAQASKPVV